jgi:hypothetical protein
VSQAGYAGERRHAGEPFYRLNVVGSHRALLAEGERLARRLAERRRRRLVIAADNRVAACPDLSR